MVMYTTTFGAYISMYDVCVCVCMHMCVCVHMCACVYICMHAHGMKEMFFLTMHSTHFIYGYMASDIW